MPKIMPENRRCPICNATLSIYNQEPVCACHSVSPRQHSARMEMIAEKFGMSLCCPGHIDKGFNRAIHDYNG